jgi:hypothetical protein
MMTPAGTQALRIARWAWEDPAGRVASALAQVREMAAAADGQELREIQDAGTMLSRLAGTLDTEPVNSADTIMAQLASDTITSQLVDLAHDNWVHELRDPSGKWTSGGSGTAKKAVRSAKGDARLRRIQAAQARHRAQQDTGNKAAAVVRQAGGTPVRVPSSMSAAEAMYQQSGRLVQTPRERALHDQIVNKAQAVAATAVANIQAKQDTHAARKAKLKLATEAGISITGGALTYLAVKSGAPEILPILATVGPFLLQTIIEFFKRL